MKRARRTRMGNEKMNVVMQLVGMVEQDEVLMSYVTNGERNRAFGRLLNKWMDSSQESVIDRYVDEEAKEATSYALNIVNKRSTEQKTKQSTMIYSFNYKL